MQSRINSLLGLAAKAGRLKSGEFAVEKAIKGAEAFLVIVAEDASEGTRKHFSDMCSFRGVPVFFYGTRQELGRCIGRENRASIAVTDEGFGRELIRQLQEDKV